MLKNIKFSLYLVLVAFFVTSCSEYQKALKNEDVAVKYELAEKLYKDEKYRKANRLFEQIMPRYVGKPQGERVVYMYADALYKVEDYYMAAYQFERFSNSYPKSTKAEEAGFYSAKATALTSPRYSLDQTDTYEALDKLQKFINKYPESELLPEANELVAGLTEKLEKKSLEIAKLYNKTMKYKACIKSVDNFVISYPGSEYTEDAMFVKLDASYKLAVNSFDYLVRDRLEDTKDAYLELVDEYPNTTYKEQALEIYNSVTEELQKRS